MFDFNVLTWFRTLLIWVKYTIERLISETIPSPYLIAGMILSAISVSIVIGIRLLRRNL